jgi:hypothetical protein
MLLAKQFEFAQQIIIICSKRSIKIIESIKLFNFLSLPFHDFLLLMNQVKKFIKGGRVRVIIIYIAFIFHTFSHKTHV